MRFSDSTANIAAALAKVQAEIKNPIKNQVNRGVQGAPLYANLEDTLQDYVRPILSKNGMSVFQSIKSDEAGRVGVCTVLFHESGEFIEGDYIFCEIKIPLSREGKEVLTKGQATGVNVTYLRRYSLNAALGINGDKDTDGSMTDEPLQDTQPTNTPKQQSTTKKNESATGGGALKCSECGATITQAESNFSKNKFGAELCRNCQKGKQS